MDPDELRLLVGGDSLNVINHARWEEITCTHVGSLSSSTVSQLSGHRLDESVDVRINRIVLESDVTIIVGPVLPHEVVGSPSTRGVNKVPVGTQGSTAKRISETSVVVTDSNLGEAVSASGLTPFDAPMGCQAPISREVGG
jgi:hypothetical protein